MTKYGYPFGDDYGSYDPPAAMPPLWHTITRRDLMTALDILDAINALPLQEGVLLADALGWSVDDLLEITRDATENILQWQEEEMQG